LPGFVVVTSPNGSKSAGKADWSPLRDRAVTVWPDADVAGYARRVARLAITAGALSVVIVSPPDNVPIGWDAADALADGWDTDRAAELITAAKPVESKTPGEVPNTSEKQPGGVGRRRKRDAPPQRDKLISLTESCEFWHDAYRTAYATFGVNAHYEHWPVRSREFRMWLSGQYYKTHSEGIGGQALEDGLRILEARAVNDGSECKPFLRVGSGVEKLYLDLCDHHWSAVEIGPAGWQLIAAPPVKFLRSSSSRRLPEPEAGGMIEDLRCFINVSDDDFMLVVAWLVAVLRDRGPYPILVVNGEQGAGKSIFSRMVRSLIDPSAAPIRALPKDDRDLVVSADNSWILAYDNLSKVAGWLSDAFCRLATGGGFATRMLHTDREESIFEATRPVLINGIPLLTERADLADRALTIHLQAVSESARRPEDEFWADFEAVRPRILGALLDAVSMALRNVSDVKLDRAPRMADFAKWCTAAEPGLGWDKGSLLAAYQRNRRDVSEAAFEADTVAVAIRDFVIATYPEGREVSPTQWWSSVSAYVSESIKKERSWPSSAQAFSNRLMRAKPLLEGKGFVIQFKHSTTRTIVIVPPNPQPSPT
jgi:putative DNA primase/helicase